MCAVGEELNGPCLMLERPPPLPGSPLPLSLARALSLFSVPQKNVSEPKIALFFFPTSVVSPLVRPNRTEPNPHSH